MSCVGFEGEEIPSSLFRRRVLCLFVSVTLLSSTIIAMYRELVLRQPDRPVALWRRHSQTTRQGSKRTTKQTLAALGYAHQDMETNDRHHPFVPRLAVLYGSAHFQHQHRQKKGRQTNETRKLGNRRKNNPTQRLIMAILMHMVGGREGRNSGMACTECSVEEDCACSTHTLALTLDLRD